MDPQQKKRLEPKYTGNQRELTDAEAANIVNDPANNVDMDDDDDNVIAAPPLSFPYTGGTDRIQP